MARKKVWMLAPPKKITCKVPEETKKHAEKKANNLIQSILKPKYVQPSSENEKFNYIVDICSKWYRSYFYFYAVYKCPSPSGIPESLKGKVARLEYLFESKFARLEYTGNEQFNLSFIRYTGQWIELLTKVSLDDCLETIKTDPFFTP